MQKLLTFVLIMFTYTLFSQPVSFFFPDKNTLSINNAAGFTSIVEVYKGNQRIGKVLIRPNSAKSIKISNYSKSLAKNLSFKAYYDLKSYNNDLQIIENTRIARIARKEREAREMAWLTFFDQLVTGGAVGKVISTIEFTELAMAGAPLDMWVERIGEELVAYGVGEIGDTRLEKAAVGAAYELSKGLQSSEFNDLNNHLENCLERLSRSRELTVKDKVIKHTKQLPEKYNYPRVTLELGYPIQRSFKEAKKEGDFVDVEGTTFNDRYPFDISLSFDRRKGFGLFTEYSRTNTFLNTNTSELTSLKVGDGLRFTSYSLGVFPSFRSWGFDKTDHFNLELRLGGIYIQQENFRVEQFGNANPSPLSTETKWGGVVEPRITLDVGKSNAFGIFAGYNFTIFKDNSGATDNSYLSVDELRVGIRLLLGRTQYDFEYK